MRKRLLAVGLVIAVIGVLVGIYHFVAAQAWRWDFTANREFSLSSQTSEVLKHLNQPVKITAFFRRNGDPDSVFIRRKVDDVLKEYAARSRSLSYRMVDPDLEPEAATKIMTDGTILFSAGPPGKESTREVYRSQLFDYSGAIEEGLPQFMGEGAFTNAILKVTRAQPIIGCLLQGYGERPTEGSDPETISGAKETLTKNNYEVQTFSFISTSEVPQACTFLWIAGPSRSIEAKADELIEGYLEKGGRLFLTEDPGTPVGLANTLKLLGVHFENTTVKDPERHFLLGPHYPAPLLADHEITRPIRQMNPILGIARGLSFSEGAQALLTTTGGARLAAAIEAEGKPRAVIVGDTDFYSNGLLEAPGNLDLFLNMVAWLTGDKDQIAIHPKTPEFRTVTLTSKRVRFISIFSQVGFPLLILLTGGRIWYRRRRS